MIRFLSGAAAALLILTAPLRAAAGITRSCGPDAVANTAIILCAPPSGPCDATSVVVGASLTLTDGPCRFDLEGRSLTIARTLQFRVRPENDQNLVGISGATDVTIARKGRLKTRGDFAAIGGQFTYGGFIDIHATGTVRLAGLVDVSGDSGGTIEIHTDGDIVFESRAKIRANGRSKLSDMGIHYADGGYLIASASAGSISIAGQIQMRGNAGATGGIIDGKAGRNIEVTGKIDVSGGGFGGGEIGLAAADDLSIVGAKIDARSRGGGEDGGSVIMEAGRLFSLVDGQPVVGLEAVGNLRIERTLFNVDGSANDIGVSGAGGTVWGFAYGNIDVTDVIVRANGASSPEYTDGYGGDVDFEAKPVPDYRDPLGFPSPFDVHVSGRISVRGGGPDGFGGFFGLYAPRHIVDDVTVDLDGRLWAGDVQMVAGGDLEIRKPIAAAGYSTIGSGSRIEIAAGTEGVGRLLIASDILAGGGANAEFGQRIDLRGCPVEVAPGVTIDASNDVDPNGDPGMPSLAFASGRPLVLGSRSRYLAGPAGTISASHPPLQAPVIGAGVSLDPPLLDLVVDQSAFPTCPRCGDGPGDDCDPRVHLGTVTSGADPIDATVAIESPLGLPLSGAVSVCAGAGVEDVTFTWLALTCDPHDVFELLVNDTVVAAVPTDVGSCDCQQGPESYTVPIADVAPLLTAGANRFGIRTSAVALDEGCRLVRWAYATVTSDGVATRVPIVDHAPVFAPLGSDPFATTNACAFTAGCAAVDASGSTALCHEVASASWAGGLPCGLDLSPLTPDQDYTLLVTATDGIIATPAFATRDFGRAAENALTVNGNVCP